MLWTACRICDCSLRWRFTVRSANIQAVWLSRLRLEPPLCRLRSSTCTRCARKGEKEVNTMLVYDAKARLVRTGWWRASYNEPPAGMPGNGRLLHPASSVSLGLMCNMLDLTGCLMKATNFFLTPIHACWRKLWSLCKWFDLMGSMPHKQLRLPSAKHGFRNVLCCCRGAYPCHKTLLEHLSTKGTFSE